MISKNRLKLIRSLELKKNRTREGLFVAEGPKVVGDLMEVSAPRMIMATEEWMKGCAAGAIPSGCECVHVTDEELCKASFLQHPQQVLALFDIPGGQPVWDGNLLSLALDGIQDPGNLGTIIRIADWFGIRHIYCSPDTADAYNPKVIQATMGSIAHVRVTYTDLLSLFDNIPADYPVYGTLLDGDDIFRQSLTPYGLVVMGNEGKGISPAVRRRVNRRLLIPNFSEGHTAESLNVAIATAITCAEFRRR